MTSFKFARFALPALTAAIVGLGAAGRAFADQHRAEPDGCRRSN